MKNEYSNNVICPYCKCEDEEWGEYIGNHNEMEIKCPSCDKEFNLEIMRDTWFTTRCKEHTFKYDHDYHSDKYNKDYKEYICIHCGEKKVEEK